MSTKSLMSLIVIALFGTGLVGCGGGSASSGGGGGGSGSSANLVVKVNGSGSAHFQQGAAETRIAAVISEFLIREAEAQTSEVQVTVYNTTTLQLVASGETVGGEVAFAVPTGQTYYVCFDGATPPDCPTVTVDEGKVIEATATETSTGVWEFTAMQVANEEHPEVFEDPENEAKVVICHIPPGNPDAAHTISVGKPATEAHLGHGDTLGACPNNPQIASEDGSSEDDESIEDDDSGRGPPGGVPPGQS